MTPAQSKAKSKRTKGALVVPVEPDKARLDMEAQLEEIHGLLQQQQRRTSWLVVAVLLMAVTNLDLIGNALRMVLYGLLIVGILAGVYWFALQRGQQGKKL